MDCLKSTHWFSPGGPSQPINPPFHHNNDSTTPITVHQPRTLVMQEKRENALPNLSAQSHLETIDAQREREPVKRGRYGGGRGGGGGLRG